MHGSSSCAIKCTVKSTSRGGSLLVDDNHHSYYKKKENFYVCTEHKKEKANCPVTAKIVDTELIINGANSHNSTKQMSKMIRQEVTQRLIAGSDARPLRILANITNEMLISPLEGPTSIYLPEKESLLRNIRYQKQKASRRVRRSGR